MNRAFLLIASLFLLGTTQTAIAAEGKALYQSTCIACHGNKGQGAIPGVPNLTRRLAKSDAELTTNIINGFQSKGSPMAMPAKGGNPSLTSADAKALVVYLRLLMGASAATVPTTSTMPEPAPVAAPAREPAPAAAPQDMTAFARGAKAWANNCARCHTMRDPKELSDSQVKVVMTHMRLRAGMDEQQVRDITVFLKASN